MAWLVFNDAFLSIVADLDHPDGLLVRSRAEGHIDAVFPEAKVFELDTSDYRYRARVSRERVAEAVSARMLAIDYPNFKNSIPSGELKRFAMDVWQAGVALWGTSGSWK